MLEGKGATVGLLVTEGHRQVLHIARSFVPGGLAGWIIWNKPPDLAALEHTIEVPGRIGARGDEVAPLDERTVRDALAALAARGIEDMLLWFTDLEGHLKSFSITTGEVEGALDDGMGFDPKAPAQGGGNGMTNMRSRAAASSAAGLQHPNVVGVFDRGEHDGTYYIAMQLLEGRSLKELIDQGLTPEQSVGLVRQVLEAAGFAHRHGVVHRDLKPQNVIVDAEGKATVTDFGIARAGASEITAEGQFSLGYPRRDGGEQINARVRLKRRPMADLKRAFELDDYDMDGLGSGEYHVYGNYETPLGFGRLLIDGQAVAIEDVDPAALGDAPLLQVVVDRLKIEGDLRARLTDSIEVAYQEARSQARRS